MPFAQVVLAQVREQQLQVRRPLRGPGGVVQRRAAAAVLAVLKPAAIFLLTSQILQFNGSKITVPHLFAFVISCPIFVFFLGHF